MSDSFRVTPASITEHFNPAWFAAIMGIDPTVIVTLCTFGIVMAWGFAVWWHVMAVVVTACYITRMERPYALSWWAFTFPSGALCVASGVAWQATGFGIIQLFYHYSVIFMLLVWVMVLIHRDDFRQDLTHH